MTWNVCLSGSRQTNIWLCFLVSVKVQFFCLPIGQNRITCRCTKRHVHCVLCRGGNRSTMKHLLTGQWYNGLSALARQPWSSKVHLLNFFIKNLRRSIYLVLVSKFTPITDEIETSGKQCVLLPFDRRCCPRLRMQRRSRVHKTHCFPRSQ
jgi:hypothetical protein